MPIRATAGEDAGLGTAYERAATAALIERWTRTRPIATALEGPVDGMAGMPGLHLLPLARRGTRVTVITPTVESAEAVRTIYARAGCAERLDLRQAATLPSPGPRWDLVLSFNALPLVDDWRGYLSALLDLGHRAVVSVTNVHTWGAAVRRVLRLAERAPRHRELFEHPCVRPAALEPELARAGRIVDRAYFDAPWWPDLFVDAGQSLVGATFARFGRPTGARAGPTRFRYDPRTYPFVGGPPPPALARALALHPGFDRAPTPVARRFAHHAAWLVET